MTGQINGKLLRQALAAERDAGGIDWGVSEETYQFWKGTSGNAKARRKWRRKDIPNSQRVWAKVEVMGVNPARIEPPAPRLVDAVRCMTNALRGNP